MIIEELKKEDIIEYKKLIDEAFDGSNDLSKYESYNEKSGVYKIIVAKDNEKIVGTATMYFINLFTFSFQPTIELFNVAVSKDYRRKRVGTFILDYVKKYAKENGYNQIHFTCLEDEINVHKFYESNGFKKANSRKYFLNI